jgi:GNAT superfamily N-acetyltransferase
MSPWLAGLFVLPRFRQMGLGRLLTAAVVEQATALGYASIHPYTTIGDFYRRQGWATCEEVIVQRVVHEVMTRALEPRG